MDVMHSNSNSAAVVVCLNSKKWGRCKMEGTTACFWTPPLNWYSVIALNETLSAWRRAQLTSSNRSEKSRSSGGRCRESWLSGATALSLAFGLSTGAQMCCEIRFLLL